MTTMSPPNAAGSTQPGTSEARTDATRTTDPRPSAAPADIPQTDAPLAAGAQSGSQSSPPSGGVVIETRKLSKTFSHQGLQQHVLKNLDLQIRRGDFTVIMGPSGAGKSTLLYALSGMDRPTLGSVVFDGEDITGYSSDRLAVFRRRHCGFVFQQIHLLNHLSLLDNVLAVGLLTQKRDIARRRAADLFDRVGLDAAARAKFPAMVSGGEGQRAAVVRAMINEPSVLFADEPTGQLNSEYGQLVLDVLSGLHAGGQSVVLVTHDLRSALRGSRILYLRDGSIHGDLDLGSYDPQEQARHQRLTSFLAEMGW